MHNRYASLLKCKHSHSHKLGRHLNNETWNIYKAYVVMIYIYIL
jgi:hypothetical protein